jgi:hypothetical protein
MTEEMQNSYYSAVRAGDLVRLTKGETKVEGRVLVATNPRALIVIGRPLTTWDREGFDIEVVEQGFSSLPDGLYIDKKWAHEPHRAVVYRNRAGQMTVLNPEHEGLPASSTPESPVLLVAATTPEMSLQVKNPAPSRDLSTGVVTGLGGF